MTVFFTSDTHFDDERTLNFSRRPFDNVLQMNTKIVTNWNEVVGETDIVYHLGDFGDPDWVKMLHGFIFLIPGNYDDEETINRLSPHCQDILSPNYVTQKKGVRLQLIHAPNEAEDKGHFFLFGHIHKLQMVKSNGLNVGVDCHNFYPITLDEVFFYKNAIENHYDENVFLRAL